MKFASAALTAHLAQGQTTATTCLKITRTDGVIIGITELDQDVTFDGVDYIASSGFSRLNLQDKANLEVSNIQLDGMIDAVFTRDDLLERKYDYANVEVFLVNWGDVSMGKMTLLTGRFGTVTIKEYSFSVQMFGMSNQLTATGGELCSPTCRVDLGSPRCGIDITPLSQTGAVVSTDGYKTLTVSGVTVGTGVNDPTFDGGLISWTSGANSGLSGEVKTLTGGGGLALFLDSLAEINVGDTFVIQPGCDKTFDTCKNVFNNGVNFQGEPYVPGLDHLLDYPDFKPPKT